MNLVLIVFFTYFLFLVFLYFYQRNLLYHPNENNYLEDKIDLNQYLVKHPASTFLVRASGNSMINAGIFPNDILVVDKSVKAESGNVVIAIIDGELTVKRYIKKRSSVILQPENEDYEPIELNGKSEAQIWGVVTSVIHDL